MGKSVARVFGAMMLVWTMNVGMELGRGRFQLLVILAGFVFFQLCNGAIEHLIRNGSLAVAPASADTFINTGVSLIHSVLLSFSVAACLLMDYTRHKDLQKMLEFESLYSHPWPGAYSLLAFSCGYFAYDQLDMLRRHLHQGIAPPLLIHHFLLLNCFTLALLRKVSINYLVLTLICEMHSVFLHWRRVGRMLNKRRFIAGEWLLNWTTFFITRLVVHVIISLKVYEQASKFPSRLELMLASSGMLGLNVLNLLLGLDLGRACYRELLSPNKSTKRE